MKKKIIFAVATGLFALATVFNMNVLQLNNAGDVSLESIAVMAKAFGESGVMPSDCFAVWEDVSCKSSNGTTYSYAKKV